MSITGFFPIIDARSGEGELREVHAECHPHEANGFELFLVPKNSNDEPTQIEQALASLKAFTSHRRGRRTGATSRGMVNLDLQSERASTDNSLQLAVAALAWAARLPPGRARPRPLLVATGALVSAPRVRASGKLSVEAVGGVALKAQVTADALEPGGLLHKMTAAESRSGYAGCPVMFAYPAEAERDPEANAALQDLARAGVQLVPVSDFDDLLLAWAGVERPRFPWRKLAAGAAAAGAVAAACYVFPALPAVSAQPLHRLWTVAEQVWAEATFDPALLRLAGTAAGHPDDPQQGCAAFAAAAGQSAARGSFGWGAIGGRLDACTALLDCDQGAASPMERPDGRLLTQMAADPVRLRQVREACAAAEAAYPTLPRLPRQRARTIEAGQDPAGATELTQALQRAEELGDIPATVELLRRLAGKDPELVRRRLADLSKGNDAHPAALRGFGELLSCGILSPQGVPSADDLQQAAKLFDRAATASAALTMAGAERDRLPALAASTRRALQNGTGTLPAWCHAVAQAVAGP